MFHQQFFSPQPLNFVALSALRKGSIPNQFCCSPLAQISVTDRSTQCVFGSLYDWDSTKTRLFIWKSCELLLHSDLTQLTNVLNTNANRSSQFFKICNELKKHFWNFSFTLKMSSKLCRLCLWRKYFCKSTFFLTNRTTNLQLDFGDWQANYTIAYTLACW